MWGRMIFGKGSQKCLSKISVNSLKHFKDLKFSRSSVDAFAFVTGRILLAALETLSWYFDATRDSDVVPVQVGQVFEPAYTAPSQPPISFHGAA